VIGEATGAAPKFVGLEDEQVTQVQNAVELVSMLLLLRRLGKVKGPPSGAPPAQPKPPRDRSWKAKVSGKAQKTGTPGHQFRTYREAIKEAKNPEVVRVHLDHGYNQALGVPPKTISHNRRPDVTSVYSDGRVKRIEVQSKSDDPAFLQARNQNLDSQIRSQGFTPLPPDVIEPSRSPQ
jgi:hypothetical protein